MTGSIYDLFANNVDLEKGGITVDYGKAGTFKIARAGGTNEKYARVLEMKSRPYRRQIATGTLDEKVANRLMAEVFAQTVVLGWEGVTEKDGAPILFSVENCTKLFTDLPDFFGEIREQANKLANFQIASVEDDAKN